MKFRLSVLISVLCLSLMGQQPLRVLVVDGHNNHDWKVLSKHIEGTLRMSERFEVAFTTAPRDQEEFAAWLPSFKAHDTVICNYNGPMWPKPMREAFMKYMEEGGGCLFIHAANNAFKGWAEYDRMIGLGWRDAKYGHRIIIDPENNRMIRVPKGEGIGAGHGRQHPFALTTRSDHPITKGLPRVWMHAKDELYQGQRGPAVSMTMLLSAYADPRTGGSGKHEPMLWTIPVGKGRAVVCLMGHNWKGQKETPALLCVGYQTIVERSTEWAATGKVTLPVPSDFPTATKTSTFDSTVHAPISTPFSGIQYRIACVGDSITFGATVKDRARNCWPAVLGRKTGAAYSIRNFGVSGATLQRKSSRPYMEQKAYKASLAFGPHAVLLMLGTNDTKSGSLLEQSTLKADLNAFIDSYRALPTAPRVFLLLPPPVFASQWGINEKALAEVVIPAIRSVGRARGCAVIDLHESLKVDSSLFPDSVHPNAMGAAKIAEIIHKKAF